MILLETNGWIWPFLHEITIGKAHLLYDLAAPEAEWGWVLDWLVQDLTDVERQALAHLTVRFDKVDPQMV